MYFNKIFFNQTLPLMAHFQVVLIKIDQIPTEAKSATVTSAMNVHTCAFQLPH